MVGLQGAVLLHPVLGGGQGLGAVGGAVGGVGGPPPSSLITPFTALLLTGDITVTSVQLDVTTNTSLSSLSSSWFLFSNDGTGRVNFPGQAPRNMAWVLLFEPPPEIAMASGQNHNDGDEENIEGAKGQYDWVLPL